MQFIAKDFLNFELGGAPGDSPASLAGRAFLAADLVAAELAAESLRTSGRLRLRVRGESMLPTLWPGDVVEIASCSVDDVRPGEIVLALREGRFFLHRVFARLDGDGFLLRGDSMPGPDPEFRGAALIGRLAGSSCSLSPWSWILGRIFCYCGPARRLALKLRARLPQSLKPRDAIALADDRPGLAPARGPGRPRHTISSQAISELPRARA